VIRSESLNSQKKDSKKNVSFRAYPKMTPKNTERRISLCASGAPTTVTSLLVVGDFEEEPEIISLKKNYV